MDFKNLEEVARDPKNKILILCSPHNPVGRIWKKEELIEISRICRENNVLIATDEIHGDLIRKGETFYPLATLVDNSNIITATAVNKTFNLAGLHCTNVIIKNPKLREKFSKTVGMVMPTPFTIAAVIAAYNESEEWLEALKEYLDATIDWVLDFLKQNMPKVKCLRPEGSYILWMDFRAYNLTPEEIHDKIYKKANVLLEGGLMFDPEYGGGFERVCSPSPRSVIKEAFERIAEQFKGL
jgi:cystathionine beta-lyase